MIQYGDHPEKETLHGPDAFVHLKTVSLECVTQLAIQKIEWCISYWEKPPIGIRISKLP